VKKKTADPTIWISYHTIFVFLFTEKC